MYYLHQAHQHDQMLMFHGELAFLLRTFFFVLLGMLVDFAGLRARPRCLRFCVSPRFWRPGKSQYKRERLVWHTFSRWSLSWDGVAFAIILLSNLIVLVGTFRAGGRLVAHIELNEAADKPQPAACLHGQVNLGGQFGLRNGDLLRAATSATRMFLGPRAGAIRSPGAGGSCMAYDSHCASFQSLAPSEWVDLLA